MVASGFSRVEGIDYTKTFAPVAKLTLILVLYSMVASLNLLLHQIDVETAFLNGNLRKRVCRTATRVREGRSIVNRM